MKIPAIIFCMGGLTTSAMAAEMMAPTPPSGDLQVIGAQAQAPSSWPATFIYRTKSGGGCTATAVGPQAILTAAHCVEPSEQSTVLVAGKSISISCDQHPGYAARPSDTSLDFALCLSGEPLKGFAFESVGTSVAYPRKGQPIQLLGYGCTKQGGFDKGFGVLYLGSSVVERRPPGRDNYTVTKGPAAVCFGDSGGGAYFYTSTQARVIVGVNSRGDISEYSFIASTFIPSFVEWAVSWGEAHKAPVCGLNTEATGCRPL